METYEEMRPGFTVAGLAVRTSNDAEADPDTGRIVGLWQQVASGELPVHGDPAEPGVLYATYTDYEQGETGDYTLTIGLPVPDPATLPESAAVAVIPEAHFLVFRIPPGDPAEVVPGAWAEIWQYFRESPDHRRTFTGDFERYEESPEGDMTVTIHIAIG